MYHDDWDSPRGGYYGGYCRRCGQPIDSYDDSGLCWSCAFDTGDVSGELCVQETAADGGADNG
jgi:hypothetical protein